MSVLSSLESTPLSDHEINLVMPAYLLLKQMHGSIQAQEAIATVCRVLFEPPARIHRVLAHIFKGLAAPEY